MDLALSRITETHYVFSRATEGYLLTYFPQTWLHTSANVNTIHTHTHIFRFYPLHSSCVNLASQKRLDLLPPNNLPLVHGDVRHTPPSQPINRFCQRFTTAAISQLANRILIRFLPSSAHPILILHFLSRDSQKQTPEPLSHASDATSASHTSAPSCSNQYPPPFPLSSSIPQHSYDSPPNKTAAHLC